MRSTVKQVNVGIFGQALAHVQQNRIKLNNWSSTPFTFYHRANR